MTVLVGVSQGDLVCKGDEDGTDGDASNGEVAAVLVGGGADQGALGVTAGVTVDKGCALSL